MVVHHVLQIEFLPIYKCQGILVEERRGWGKKRLGNLAVIKNHNKYWPMTCKEDTFLRIQVY